MKGLALSVIGTDTDVGKTFVTGLLGALAVADGFDVGMVKPVSSSAVPFPECISTDEDNLAIHLESKDATYLMRAVGIPESRRHEVNPYALAGDYSPRLAAELAEVDIDYDEVVHHIQHVVPNYDITFIEGAGGITTPLIGDYTFSDLMKDIAYPALVVADGRLGSINRAVLTCAYAKQHNIDVKGIIVNDTTLVDPFLLKTNIADMERYTGVPVLGVLPPYKGPDQQKVLLGWGRSFLDIERIWTAIWGDNLKGQ